MEISISFLDIWKFIKRNLWKFIIIIVLVAIVGGLLSIRAIPRSYESSSVVSMGVNVPEDADYDVRNQVPGIVSSRVTVGLAMVNGTNGDQMKEDVASYMGIDVSKIQKISALQLQGGPNIQIKITTDDPTLSAKISDAACEVLKQKLTEMFPTPPLVIEMVDHGQKASVASARGALLKGGVMSGLLALIVCFIFSILRVLLDRRVRNSKALATATGVPLLGFTTIRKKSDHQEELRRIRAATTLQAGDSRTVLLAPIGSAENTFTVQFARSLASCGKKVLLLYTGMAMPQKVLPVSVTHTVYDVLQGKATLQEAVVETNTEGLSFMGVNGDLPAAAGDLLASDAFQKLMQECRDAYDYVLVSCMVLPNSAQADTLASRCDATVLLVRYGVTPYTTFQQAQERLQEAGGKVIGFVTTNVE